MRFNILFSFCFLGSAPAAAGFSEPVQPASACPALFGSADSKAANRKLRQEHLDSIRQADYTIDLTHTTDWASPERIRYQGLELVDTRRLPERGRVAVVRVDGSVGQVDCRPGLYRVKVDDSIGDRGSVLAVLDDVVLLAREGQLRYLVTRSSEPPVFRMIWRATWKLPLLPGGQVGVSPKAGRRVGAKPTSTRTHTRRR